MLARRITFLRTLRTKLNHLVTYCCRLFVALEKVKSYRISNFQTLFAKHPGVGGGTHHRYTPCEARSVSPLFSQPYESLFSQPLSFHIHPKPPGSGGHHRATL